MEREAEDDIAAGRFVTFADVESFLAALDAQSGESSSPRSAGRDNEE
jgi:hypothetical protein